MVGRFVPCPSTASKWELRGKSWHILNICWQAEKCHAVHWWSLEKAELWDIWPITVSGRSSHWKGSACRVKHWAMVGADTGVTLKDFYSPYWLFKLQQHFEELRINQSACSSSSQRGQDMVQKEPNRLPDLKSIIDVFEICCLFNCKQL